MINEEILRQAEAFMAQKQQEKPAPSKFPFLLPDNRDFVTSRLLGCYGAEVAYRDRDFKMDEYTLLKVEKVVKWIYDSKKRGLFLCGTVGNGKTTMLKAICSLFYRHTSYYEAGDIFNKIKDGRSLEYYSEKNILLIDELGREPESYNNFGEVHFPLTEVLSLRYKLNLPTIIASNYSFEDVGKKYGDRIYDRMKEMYAIITYLEPSYRD